MVARDQALALGLVQRPDDGGDFKAGALAEHRHRKAFGEPQRIHHEFEGQVLARDFVLLGHRRAPTEMVEVTVRLFEACLAQDAIGKRQLAVRPRADAQIVAKAPVVEVVPALLPFLRYSVNYSISTIKKINPSD